MYVSRDSGKISKTLQLQRFDQGQDWYLQLAVKDSAGKEGSATMGLPITGAELYTLKTLSEVSPYYLLAQKSRLPSDQNPASGTFCLIAVQLMISHVFWTFSIAWQTVGHF